MIEASLLPRSFRIEQSVNEYVYFVNMHEGRWYIELGNGDLLHRDYQFRPNSLSGPDASFDDPIAALDFWKGYAALYIKDKAESIHRDVERLLNESGLI